MRSVFEKIIRWWQTEGLKKKEINYLYFAFLLGFLSLLSLSYFLWIENASYGIPLFFLIYALGQALLEIFCFILAAYILKRWAPQWVFLCFIAFSFCMLLLHFTDFTLFRLMDASLSYVLKFFFGSGMIHIFTAFQALNMNGSMIALILAVSSLIPIAGLFVYWLTHKVSLRKPLKVSLLQIGGTLVAIGASLFILDLFAHPFLNRYVYTKYQKILPFGKTFLPPTLHCIELAEKISSPRSEPEVLRHLDEYSAAERPNLYFFIIETLRKDFVHEGTAPALTAFGKESLAIPATFSNANSTMASWFALFHANYPYHWTSMRDQWKGGSVPLQLLKKLGYKIRVYSAADLRYFNMDKLLFGQTRGLPDKIEEYSSNRLLEPCERDAMALASFERDIASEDTSQGNAFFFFLDSTHSEYSFPKDFPLKFEPIVKEIDYLSMGPMKKELEFLKNRYRNAICYIDSLVDRFFSILKKYNLYETSLIAITGDHGEEFFEEGALFHGTHLNHYQLSVPIFLKFPSMNWKVKTSEATHMDIFPSILHYLTKREDFSSLFDGQSLFSDHRWPYRIAVLQNGADTPCEFSIEQGDQRLHARFLDPRQIYDERKLEIVQIQIPGGFSFEKSLQSQIDSHFPSAFDPLVIIPK